MKTYLKGMNKRWKKRMFKAWHWGCFLHSPSSCQFSLKLDKTLSVERMATETPHWPLAATSPALQLRKHLNCSRTRPASTPRGAFYRVCGSSHGLLGHLASRLLPQRLRAQCWPLGWPLLPSLRA